MKRPRASSAFQDNTRVTAIPLGFDPHTIEAATACPMLYQIQSPSLTGNQSQSLTSVNHLLTNNDTKVWLKEILRARRIRKS